MTPLIKITTKSGSIYEIMHKDGKTFFRKGIRISGEIVKLHKRIKIGDKLDFDYKKDGLYGNPEDFITQLRSSQITDIEVWF